MGDAGLRATAAAMVGPGKGILAADESTATITSRFEALGITSTWESRRDYREMLLTAPGLGDAVSGVILYDETIRQEAADGTPIPEVLAARGMMPGIKVDTGAKPMALAAGETVTEGLDGLRERVAEYRGLGARFAKWRAVITIDGALPTERCVHANAHALARYAAICQEGGLVPIVEPEVLMAGGHDIETCAAVTGAALTMTFEELTTMRVDLEATVLKPNMVLPGKACERRASAQEVAEATLRCLHRSVPVEVPGVAFLSGGQDPVTATVHLDAMNRLGDHPWELSFSYGRALQDPALAAWKGDPANVDAGKEALAHRARCNGAARSGTYDPSMEES